MSDIDAMLAEMEILLGSAVDVADQATANLQGMATGQVEAGAAAEGKNDLLAAARRVRLQLKDAKGFVATRRAHPPFIDVKMYEVPGALMEIRSLANNLSVTDTVGIDFDQTHKMIGSLGQIVHHVSRFGGPHGPGSGPRGTGLRGLGPFVLGGPRGTPGKGPRG